MDNYSHRLVTFALHIIRKEISRAIIFAGRFGFYKPYSPGAALRIGLFLFLMARPQRNNVDYFPFLCKEGTTMYYIEQKYGNDGFATWIKLLRQLAVTEYHYLNLSSKPQVMFLSAKCRVTEEILLSIIQDLCDMGEFEQFLWDESRVIFSTKFVAHVQDAYAKRSNKCIDLPGLLILLEGLGVRKPHKELGKLPLKGPVNPQRKEEKSKEEESKGESDTPATFEEIKISLFGGSEQRWVDEMTRLYGPWGPDEFDKCYQHHNNGPAPPAVGWQWKQKFGTWLSIKQKNDNEQRAKTKTITGQGTPPAGPRKRFTFD